jgi:hypothetical protein
MERKKNNNNTKEASVQPNAFLAIQVQSPDIHQRLVDVAGQILDYDEGLAGALEPVEKSHITLLGSSVNNITCIERYYIFIIVMHNFSTVPVPFLFFKFCRSVAVPGMFIPDPTIFWNLGSDCLLSGCYK